MSNFIAFAGLQVNAVPIREMRRPVRNHLKALAVAVVLVLLMWAAGVIILAAPPQIINSLRQPAWRKEATAAEALAEQEGER